MSAEKMKPETAIRVLRAKAGELEHTYRRVVRGDMTLTDLSADVAYIAAELALLASLLADHMERTEDDRYRESKGH